MSTKPQTAKLTVKCLTLSPVRFYKIWRPGITNGTSTKHNLGQVKSKTKQKFLFPVRFSFWARLSLFLFVISNVQEKPIGVTFTLYPVLLN